RTPCRLAPSAVAGLTAVVMLLPGLLVALLPAIAVIVSIMPLARNAWRVTTAKDVPRDNQQVNLPLMLPCASLPHVNVTAACQNGTCGPFAHAHAIASSLQHADALNVPLHSLHTLIRGLVEERERKFAAVKRELDKAERRRAADVNELRGLLEEKERDLEEAEGRQVAEMREMRGQVEERERELAAVQRELAAVQRELAAYKDIMKKYPDLIVELYIRESEGNTKAAWEVSAEQSI
ncbi:unnamed protein product, partial [Closterium sp. Naga37s-1]